MDKHEMAKYRDFVVIYIAITSFHNSKNGLSVDRKQYKRIFLWRTIY